MADNFEVNAYSVEGQVDYDELVKKFGTHLIDDKLKQRIKKDAGDLHFMLRRNIFFSQRDMNWLLDEYEKGNKFYIYTGIAPSGGMTIGHLVPFIFTQWLQEKFGAEVYLQIPDEEKFLLKKDPSLTLEIAHERSYDVAANIMSLGFDPKKTKILMDTESAKVMYKQAVRVARNITFSTVKDAFGFTNETNTGLIFYTAMQTVPTFIKSVEEGKNVPCLIPMAIDQDVHFRISRDIVDKLGYYKPAAIHTKFLPSLKGGAKMSASSTDNDTIFVNDDAETVIKKVNRAKTGQQDTMELQKKFGGNPDNCMVCQYNRYLFEPDDKKLEKIFEGERKGTLMAGEHKKDLATKINKFLEEHRKRKEHFKGKIDSLIIKE